MRGCRRRWRDGEGMLGLTAAMARAHTPHTAATAKGHLDQRRQGLDSTAPDYLAIDPDLPSDGPHLAANHAEVHLFSQLSLHTLFADATGRFPVRSASGSEYFLVTVFDGYIHIELLRNRSHLEYIAAFERTLNFFAAQGHHPVFVRTDNEVSQQLDAFFRARHVEQHRVPPGIHRANSAERHIRTFKNHFIATISTASPNFPLGLFDKFIPQAEICLAHLMPCHSRPHLSAYEGIFGTPFDFLAHPIGPLGTAIVIHTMARNRRY